MEALARNPISPMTRVPLDPATLVDNVALRDAIEEWRRQLPLALDPDRLDVADPEELLGSGSFGKVVVGTLQSHGRDLPVAVKVLHPPALTRSEQRAQFDGEVKAQMTAQQGADNVCRLLGTCEKNHQLCLVMKRYTGGNLAAMIVREGPLPGPAVRRIAHPLFRALGQLHAAGVVVQDIKPENILLNQFGTPVFADFGIAGVIGRTTKIMPTSVKGTFNYMAPEAFEPPLGVEADVWSMGCVVLQMCTGVAPWDSMPMQQIITAVLVRQRAPEVPDTVPAADRVRQCFAFDAAGRPTAVEMAAALQPELAPVGEVVDGLARRLERQAERHGAEKAALQQQLAAAQARGADTLLVAEKDAEIARLTASLASALVQAAASAPVCVAAEGGHLEVVRLLVQSGESVTRATADGDTPLWKAAVNGHLAVVQWLAGNGGSVTQCTHND